MPGKSPSIGVILGLAQVAKRVSPPELANSSASGVPDAGSVPEVMLEACPPMTWACELQGVPLTSMREDIVLAEAGEIELGAGAEETEGGLGKLGSPLARQHGVELGLEGMQVQHV